MGGNHNVGSARYQGSEFPFLVEKPIHELLSSKINKSTSMLRRFLLQVSVDRKKNFKKQERKKKRKGANLCSSRIRVSNWAGGLTSFFFLFSPFFTGTSFVS